MRIKNLITEESGFMLIGTILILVAVTAIGVTLINVSNIEVDITTSEKCKEVARYNSESCSVSGAKLIKFVADEANKMGILGIPEGDNRVLGITYAEPSDGGTKESELATKILGANQETDQCEDFSLTPANTDMDAAANIQHSGADANIGTAANRQISGYSYGVGLGGAGGGGFANFFIVACRGGGCNQNGRHMTYTRYKRVPGISGGF